MTDLLNWAISAHGGLDRWNGFQTASLELSVDGALWELKKQHGLFANSTYDANIHRQKATLGRLGATHQRVRFAPERVVLESESGVVVEIRDDPRAAFVGHTAQTPWDLLHAAYFDGYALWTYLTQPFLYSYPGFMVTEIDPWEENGEVWRRLNVVFPDEIASHSREQVSYFGPDGLLRRHDYSVDVLGGASATQYIADYRERNGLMMPHHRRVYSLGSDNRRIPEPLLVDIRISSLRFAT